MDVLRLPFSILSTFDDPDEQLDTFSKLLFRRLFSKQKCFSEKSKNNNAICFMDERFANQWTAEKENQLRYKAHQSQTTQALAEFSKSRIKLKTDPFSKRHCPLKVLRKYGKPYMPNLNSSTTRIKAYPNNINKHFNITAQQLTNVIDISSTIKDYCS